MEYQSLDAAIKEMEVYIKRDVAAGFAPLGEIVDAAVEVFSDDCDPVILRPYAESIAKVRIEEHLQQQVSWPAMTDCDRLDAAFAALEESGIVCRQNFSCCGNCGSGEIWDEINAQRDAGREIIGYVFYHMQDTESAAEGYGLCLSYGSVLDGARPALGIASQAVEVLTRFGISTFWDGTWNKRIMVKLDWKRRR